MSFNIQDSPSKIVHSEGEYSPSLLTGSPRSSSRNSVSSLDGRLSISSGGELPVHPQFVHIVADVPPGTGLNRETVVVRHFEMPLDDGSFSSLKLVRPKAIAPMLTDLSLGPSKSPAASSQVDHMSDEESSIPTKFSTLSLGPSQLFTASPTRDAAASSHVNRMLDEEPLVS